MAVKKKSQKQVKKVVKRKDGLPPTKQLDKDIRLPSDLENQEEEQEEEDEEVQQQQEEVDTLGPDVEEIAEDEEVIEDEPIEYNNLTKESYLRKKLVVPQNLDMQEQNFLSQVDTSKGEIERKVTKICRVKAVDQKDKQKKRKEFIYYYENWYGKDWVGNDIPPVTDHVEGIYYEQLTQNIINKNRITGKKRTGQQIVYYIPFSKQAVDKIIENSVGSDKETILFNFSNGPLGYEFPYDVFVNESFDNLARMLVMPGGPRLELAKREQEKAQEDKNALKKRDEEIKKLETENKNKERSEEISKMLHKKSAKDLEEDEKMLDNLEKSNEKIDQKLEDIMESDAEAMDEMEKQKKDIEKAQPDNTNKPNFDKQDVV